MNMHTVVGMVYTNHTPLKVFKKKIGYKKKKSHRYATSIVNNNGPFVHPNYRKSFGLLLHIMLILVFIVFIAAIHRQAHTIRSLLKCYRSAFHAIITIIAYGFHKP